MPLAPFVHRWRILAAAVLLAGSLVLAPVLPSWPEFVQVVRDARDPMGALYSLLEVPMLLVPLIAGWGQTRHHGAPATAAA